MTEQSTRTRRPTTAELETLRALTDLIDTARTEQYRPGIERPVRLNALILQLDAARTRLVQDGDEYLDQAWAYLDAGRAYLAHARIDTSNLIWKGSTECSLPTTSTPQSASPSPSSSSATGGASVPLTAVERGWLGVLDAQLADLRGRVERIRVERCLAEDGGYAPGWIVVYDRGRQWCLHPDWDEAIQCAFEIAQSANHTNGNEGKR